MEEFETFGDIQEIRRYLKKAQALNAKLEEAQTKVWYQQYKIHNKYNVF